MKLLLASVANRSRAGAFDAMAQFYTDRIAGYSPVEKAAFRSESAFLQSIEKERSRVAPLLVLLDSRGRTFTSEQFAAWLGQQRDAGQQRIVFGVGPADGWSETARRQAGLLLSFGPMTLPHELAHVVLCEQVYRAFTILAGHPYHFGHL